MPLRLFRCWLPCTELSFGKERQRERETETAARVGKVAMPSMDWGIRKVFPSTKNNRPTDPSIDRVAHQLADRVEERINLAAPSTASVVHGRDNYSTARDEVVR